MGREYEFIDITLEPPAKGEIAKIKEQSGVDIKKCFNTSGLVYKSENYKDKLKTMNEPQMLDALAANGKLIKRPMITDGKKSSVGFKEEDFLATWK